MKMITDMKEQVRGKSVLLYSGGMDSLMIDFLLEPDVLLNISMNSNYDKRERESFPKGKEIIYLDDVLNLGQYERDDAIVPNRNAHLVLLASHYGEHIMLGSVSGDRSFDKDEKFYLPLLCQAAAMRFLLTRLYDWVNTPIEANVVRKNQKEYITKHKYFKKLVENINYRKNHL